MAILAPFILPPLITAGAVAAPTIAKGLKEKPIEAPTPITPEEELKKAGLSAIARRNRLRRQLGRQSTILGGAALGGQPSILG